MTYVFSFLFPFLLIILLLQEILCRVGKSAGGWRKTLILIAISTAIIIIPLGGIPLARRLVTLDANFSIPFTAILFAKVWENAWAKVLFDKKALLSFWVFGAVMGVILYPMAMGLGPFDPYTLGWGFSPLFIFLMVLTIFLLYKKNRPGIVLMLCILSYNLQLLESPNLWDYLVDPFYVIISLIGLFLRIRSKNPSI
jgi:hypothetical protein